MKQLRIYYKIKCHLLYIKHIVLLYNGCARAGFGRRSVFVFAFMEVLPYVILYGTLIIINFACYFNHLYF